MIRAVLVLLAGGIATAAAIVGLGLYDVSATDPHLAPTHWLLDTTMRRSIAMRGRTVDVPALGDPVQLAQGRALYDRHCLQCHGAPGVPPEPFALGLTPAAANLAHAARDRSPGELYWTVRNGLKMTGMPAWEFRLADDELWAIVAFLQQLPSLSPADYRRETGSSGSPHDRPRSRPDEVRAIPDASRGKRAVHQYACGTCHRIPGIVGGDAPVGPPLDAVALRAFVAGVIPNTPENVARWIREPHRISPESAMPDLGVDARDAADIAAYLGTLK